MKRGDVGRVVVVAFALVASLLVASAPAAIAADATEVTQAVDGLVVGTLGGIK